MSKFCSALQYFLILICLTPAISNADKLVKLATVEWPPFFAESLPQNGYFAAISRQAYQRAGYKMAITWMPWQRAMNEGRSGKVYDGVLGAGYSKERANHFEYTDPVDIDTYVFFAHKNHEIIYKKTSDLQSYSIGGMRGDIAVNSLKASGFNIVEAATFEQIIKMLLAKRIDCFIASKRVTQSILNSKFKAQRNNIITLSPSYSEYNYHILISKQIKNHKTIAENFNNGLKEIKEDGTVNLILKDFGFGE